MHRRPACACGERRFSVRPERDQQVALVTCKNGHPSLLLDSRDHWADVIQLGRPREARCRCGGRSFEIELEYELRPIDGSVRTVDVSLHCAACNARQRSAVTFEIDYSPTDVLIERPLDPCEKPWVKAKVTELSCLWLPSDLDDVIAHLASEPGAIFYCALYDVGVRRFSLDELRTTVHENIFFDVFCSTRDVELPGKADVAKWCRRAPVIQLTSPLAISYTRGPASMYDVRWAIDTIVDGRIKKQEPALLALGQRLLEWFERRFVAKRGPNTFDNEAEWERLFGPSGVPPD